MTHRATDRIAALAALGLMVSLAAPALAAGRIAVNARSEVAGESILLGEIASISGMSEAEVKDLAGRSLGPSPRPDEEIRLSRSQIETRLYNAGLNTADFQLLIPDKTAIKRKATHVPGMQLTDFTKEFLRENIVWGGGQITVKVRKEPAEIVLPFGEVTLNGTLGSRPNQFGAKDFRIDIYLDGERVRTVSMGSYIEVYGDAVTAARPIASGAMITDEDIEFRETKLDTIRAGAVSSPDEIIGKKAKRSIRAGDVLTMAMVDVPPDVRTNDLVTLIITGNGFTITTKGKALEKGFKGDLIRVLTLGSKKVLDGIIVDAQTVEIVSSK